MQVIDPPFVRRTASDARAQVVDHAGEIDRLHRSGIREERPVTVDVDCAMGVLGVVDDEHGGAAQRPVSTALRHSEEVVAPELDDHGATR